MDGFDSTVKIIVFREVKLKKNSVKILEKFANTTV